MRLSPFKHFLGVLDGFFRIHIVETFVGRLVSEGWIEVSRSHVRGSLVCPVGGGVAVGYLRTVPNRGLLYFFGG